MFDSTLRPLIDPSLNRAGALLARRGMKPDVVTLIGLGFGLSAAAALALGWPASMALALILINRLADGLDGAVARVSGKSDFGGYLDIVCDFAFYGAIPLAFVIRDFDANATAGAFLLFAFYVNAASFLGFAAIAAKRGLETSAQGEKSFYYAAGLLEGFETIVFFAVLCLFPSAFPELAWAFGILCLVTAMARIIWVFGVLRDQP